MAKNNNGVLGAFTGTIGPVTGFMRNGQNILRTSKSSVKNQNKPRQLAQQEKIKVCTPFMNVFTGTGFLKKSFPAYGHTGTGHNRLTSVLISQALTGVYPDMQLSYPQVMISKGKLPKAQSAKASVKNSIIHFSFADNSTTGIASGDDTAILVAYAPDLQQAVFTLYGGLRKGGKATLNAAPLKGHYVETWIGFLSNDEKDASDSMWAGRVKV
jgi:hypothetical protein